MILQFKRKKKMPKNFDERIDALAEQYMELIFETYNCMLGTNSTEAEYKEAVEFVAGKLIKSCEKYGVKLGAKD